MSDKLYSLLERYGGPRGILEHLPYYPEVRVWDTDELAFGSKVRIKDGNTWYVVPYINYVPEGTNPLAALNHFHKEVYTFLALGQISGNTTGYNGEFVFQRDADTRDEKERFLETLRYQRKLS